MKKEIKIPDIAENVDTGLIASILVSEGDEVSADQALVEVETDKATTDIPSPFDGVVDEIKIEQGDEVKVNQVIAILEVSNGQEQDAKKVDGNHPESSEEEKEKGSGNEGQKQVESEKGEEENGGSAANEQIPASPLARKIARENNVELTEVKGTGPGDRISRQDVEDFIETGQSGSTKEDSRDSEIHDRGATHRVPLNQIEKITARTMTQAWKTVPQVTQFDEAVLNGLESFRKQNQDKTAKQGGKLTITAILLKVACYALQKFPRFNASYDEEEQEIIYKHFYHIGVAVDTPQGLIVPVIHDVNQKSLTELALELGQLAQKARDKKISPDEIQGGTFTISNLGGIGGTGFSPIVYPPQVAILGVAAAKNQPVMTNGKFKERLVLPLSLSYDHRVINGADGARFLRWLCRVIEDPYTLFQ